MHSLKKPRFGPNRYPKRSGKHFRCFPPRGMTAFAAASHWVDMALCRESLNLPAFVSNAVPNFLRSIMGKEEWGTDTSLVNFIGRSVADEGRKKFGGI